MGNGRYGERVNQVCKYIEDNLDSELTLEEISEKAFYSKYHFLRLFSAHMGVSLYQFIQQARLKRAAYQLAFHPALSITEIAYQAKFEHSESFSRTFKKRFQMSPSQFRKSPDWLLWHRHYHHIENRAEPDVKVDIRDLTELSLAVVEHHGSPKAIMDSVMTMIQWRKSTGLSPVKKSKTVGIVYHDPKSVPENEFRFDIGAEVQAPIPTNEFGIINKTLAGGRYAIARHFGSHDQISDTIYAMYRQWLPQSGEELRGDPLFFHYLNRFPDVAEHELMTDVCLPLSPLSP
ncbi:helix-turn-helix domain-containing protein [Marinomonas mediterranea]|uniref:AraC family transcriptional regulator n=1 Tax=Marinomonas mediterranea TaxID=119864 RepID=UPI002349C322|nr:AraC family transcriptional regulator [Marinomonas mediterranea]WCN15275.1 helix-turn-helix domain-containing protein [Marinomonas mediterranea]